MIGVQKSVTEKYADQAHFIYEILQNADDTKAKEVNFILRENGLIFSHNGLERFTISNVQSEADDRKQQKLGHLNSITSIGNSTKDEFLIGKFGVGFKAVFQYTDTPHIYDDFCFKIVDFIVPELLDRDLQERKATQTVFSFPFNKPEKTPEICYQEILEKLNSLSNPLLFLHNLTKIEWSSYDTKGSYEKKILSSFFEEDIQVQHIEIIHTKNNQSESQYLYIFTRKLSSQPHLSCSVGYRVTDKNQVIYDKKIPVYCFFETRETTHLKFFIQAPFLLNDSREGIPAHEQWNKICIKDLAQLAADSLPICRKLKLINDNFLNVLPINKNDFYSDNGTSKNQFSPIYDAILNKLKSEELLPVNNGESFTSYQKAYHAKGKNLLELLKIPAKDGQSSLAVFTNNSQAKWIFTTITEEQEVLWKYIKDNLVQITLDSEKFARKITKEFIDKQTDKWLTGFYIILLDVRYLWTKGRKDPFLRQKEILRLQDESIIAPFNSKDEPQAYLPTSVKSSFPVVKQCLLNNPNSRQFLQELGLRQPDKKAEIYEIIGKYESEKQLTLTNNELLSDFNYLLDYSLKCPAQDKNKLIEKLKSICFCRVVIDGKYFFKKPQDIYVANEKLKLYFEGCTIAWLDLDFYSDIYKRYGIEKVNIFLAEIGVKAKPIILEENPAVNPTALKNLGIDHLKTSPDKSKQRYLKLFDYQLEGLKNCLSKINLEKSLIIWQYLLGIIKTDSRKLKGQFNYFYRTEKKEPFCSEFIRTLKNTPWLYNKYSQCLKPSDIVIEELDNHYDIDNAQFDQLNKELGLLYKSDRTIQEAEFSLQEQIQKLKETAEQEIATLKRKEELRNIINDSEKYSFAWFKALLELEYDGKRDKEIKRNPVQVKFNRVEWDKDSQEILVLSETSYIPYSLEDNGELSLKLNLKEDSKSVLVEAVSFQKNLLKAKLKNPSVLKNIDLSEVKSAVIEIKNTDFILENLRSAFKKLNLADDCNLKNNLTRQIKFIFGPPGTGKTTYLTTQEILPKIKQQKARILVLTPTNKAADVLTETLIKKCEEREDESFDNWLIRYGVTESTLLENTVFSKDKLLSENILNKSVLVTTIARFPYDNFKIKGTKQNYQLKDFDWDYIIFDEASMIDLASIIYVLYYTTARNPQCQFIVGGDPFQISPVIDVEEEGWKEGNIYTLVELSQENSFKNPQPQPHPFKVVNLTTQYRSVPTLGTLFSQFSYNGILKHSRRDNDDKPISIKNFPLKTITLIDFKISQFESLYKPRKLNESPYHIYSAILTVELVNYIIKNMNLRENNNYRIGVICPYRVQQNIVDKLLIKNSIMNSCEVITGTVHGFQGDECDMVISLFNPPTHITESTNIFLNKKNILNVAISRARDYLILLLPNDPTQKISTEKLVHIESLKRKIREDSNINDNYTHFCNDELEKIIFGRTGMIEEFSFSTSHQSVNIYSGSEKKYEIRYDENAIDIQLKI